tara:strand:- start:392 stop:580 length:189 start_codon:yes stop_codon:yes gene_type:complete
MIEHALNNIVAYGIRYSVTLNFTGGDNYKLVMSHPVVSGKKSFTEFRGSMQIEKKIRCKKFI